MSAPTDDDPGAARRARIVAANERGNAAFSAGDMADATAAYDEAVALLTADEDGWAPALYENLALAHFNAGRNEAAVRGFLRALDGDPASRLQSAHYLVVALIGVGNYHDALRWLRAFEATFGEHPVIDEATLVRLSDEAREARARWIVC